MVDMEGRDCEERMAGGRVLVVLEDICRCLKPSSESVADILFSDFGMNSFAFGFDRPISTDAASSNWTC